MTSKSRDPRKRVDELFWEALERSPNEQHRFLENACGGDAALRAEVESLLEHDELARSDHFLENQPLSDARGSGVSGTDDHNPAPSREATTLEPNVKSGETDEETPYSGVPPGTPATIGKYTIISRLGVGGQAEVYRAVHPALASDVVIKIASRPHQALDGCQDQVLSEGRLLAGLDHPNLARVYDLDFHDNRPFLVMEYVRGRDLDQFQKNQRLTARESAALIAKLARALAVAHRQGIVHQDVKPKNVMIDESGQPRLIDFGVALLQDAWSDEVGETGSFHGTPAYMAPEQARCETHLVGQRSDVFALGAVLYWLLCGEAPFCGTETYVSVGRAAGCDFDRGAVRRAGAPRRLQQICLKAMQADPQDRYATAEDLAGDLEAFVRRPRLIVSSLVVGAALLSGALAWFWWPPQSAPTVAAELMVQVWRGGEARFLHEAVPLLNGDELQFISDVPRGSHVALVWFDTEGKLHPLEFETLESGRFDRVISPPQHGGDRTVRTIPLVGPAGTEVVLLCGSRSRSLGLEQIAEFFGDRSPWPLLPPDSTLSFDAEAVRLRGPRGPGALGPASVRDSALTRAERLRRNLSEQVDFLVGVAFPHRP